MSVARKDDRHNEDLTREIADSFNETMRAKDRSGEDTDTDSASDMETDTDSAAAATSDGEAASGQRFVITGDKRQPARRRRSR